MRIGLLAASRISVPAIIEPARHLDDVEVVAVAARSPHRASEFAAAHGINRAFSSYDDLLGDSSLDAVHVGTPASLHAEWTIKSLRAGRHVLCEKPLAGNSSDARLMAASATDLGLILMEAFHWRFHRFAERMIGEVARLRRPITIETEFNVPEVPKDNIRYAAYLGGGALMDLGCYLVHWIRTLLGEPSTIAAEMEVTVADVDDTTTAEMGFADGSTAALTCSMVRPELSWWLRASAANGVVFAQNPLAPQEGNQLQWSIDGIKGEEQVTGPSTYEAQLQSFAETITGERPPLVSLQDSINNMTVIDEMYRSAGLMPRP